MVKYTFVGGVHPYDGKDISKDKPIIEYLPKGEMVYLLAQHIGAPAKPIVKKGDYVLVGQKIAEADGYVSAHVHATVSGTVKAIEPRPSVSGAQVMSIVIDNDGEYKEVIFQQPKPVEILLKEEILKLVQDAGVVGMGGAGFPTHVKLAPKSPDDIDFVVINCAECEPYLTSDYRRMIEEPEKLVEGLRIILRLFDNARGILAVEDNKKDCIQILRKLTSKDERIAVAPLHTKYPQGSERHLLYAVTGRAINSSMLPSDAGCIVNNVDTAVAIYHAVKEGKPVMHRIVTVTGDCIENPRNLMVRIGTSYSELIAEAGGTNKEPVKIVSGGPMMGTALYDINVPVTKASSALLCFSKDEVSTAKQTACINCGRCVEVCPGRVIPSRLAVLADRGEKEAFQKLNGLECCECGCCSYICPAKRHLTQSIKSMRRMILADKKKN